MQLSAVIGNRLLERGNARGQLFGVIRPLQPERCSVTPCLE
jgi:hypothetical protein